MKPELENLDTEEGIELDSEENIELDVIYLEKIVISFDGKANDKNYNSMKLVFSDGSEEFHRNVASHTLTALQHWKDTCTPLHRFPGGTLVEAPEDASDHLSDMYRFMDQVFDERLYSAQKFANGEIAALNQMDDQLNGMSDFATYICQYATNWYKGFPPHDLTDIYSFKEKMIKVANLAYSGFRWAENRASLMEAEAQMKAKGGRAKGDING